MKHVLCFADGSEHADNALPTATGLSEDLAADPSLLVLEVTVGRPLIGPQTLSWTHDEVQGVPRQVCDGVAKRGQKPAHAEIRGAREVSTGITDHTRDHAMDAFVIGPGDKCRLSRPSPGSVAGDMANRVP